MSCKPATANNRVIHYTFLLRIILNILIMTSENAHHFKALSIAVIEQRGQGIFLKLLWP
uniref:Uncharacterized protein n=1 Tax=Anguilla anguilla TaxID=7936 RepID=A0A0E9Q9M0_ANGAN